MVATGLQTDALWDTGIHCLACYFPQYMYRCFVQLLLNFTPSILGRITPQILTLSLFQCWQDVFQVQFYDDLTIGSKVITVHVLVSPRVAFCRKVHMQFNLERRLAGECFISAQLLLSNLISTQKRQLLVISFILE